MGVSSTRGMRVPEERRWVVYVRMCTFGSEEEGMGLFGLLGLTVVVVRDAGVGAQETLMTCSMPERHIESTTSPLKKSSSMDLS